MAQLGDYSVTILLPMTAKVTTYGFYMINFGIQGHY